MTNTKEALPSLKDLQPADGSSTAIRAAFYQMRDARTSNASEIERLGRVRNTMLTSISTAEVEKMDETIRRRRVFADQCDAFEAELRQSFTAAKEAEEDVEYSTKLAEIRANEATWNADTRARYPALAAEIVALLQQESDLLQAFHNLSRMPGAHRSRENLGATLSHPCGSMTKAYLAANAEPAALSAFVRLPNLERGSALWGFR